MEGLAVSPEEEPETRSLKEKAEADAVSPVAMLAAAEKAAPGDAPCLVTKGQTPAFPLADPHAGCFPHYAQLDHNLGSRVP